MNVSVSWSQIWSVDSLQVSVRDLWAHQDMGVFETGYNVEVEAHGVVMIKVMNGTSV